MGILNLLGKTIKFTGLGLGAKEFSDYVKKMKDEGKNPYSFTNFKEEYGDPIVEKVKNAYEKTVQKKADGGMMEARKKGMGLKMNQGGMALKPVPADNKGLPNLPTSVRNKMGYMKDGGMAKKKTVKRSPKSRGTGAAVKGTKFKGVF